MAGAAASVEASDSPRVGESPARQPGAPKEQPPRNLSGQRTARAGHSGEQALMRLTDGASPDPLSRRRVTLSGSMTEGEPASSRAIFPGSRRFVRWEVVGGR